MKRGEKCVFFPQERLKLHALSKLRFERLDGIPPAQLFGLKNDSIGALSYFFKIGKTGRNSMDILWHEARERITILR